MRSDQERLLDILEAIQRIERRSPDDKQSLAADELVQTWVLHHLRILGEAVRALSADFQNGHPEWPWSGIIGMRNILVHHYFEIDNDAVWSVLKGDLPALKARVQKALAELP
ncbi:MAG: DUF86 domain-containing protein [Thermoguttaceae bacterium]|jgi:uncharacterized protein with HEPN domain